MRESRRAVRRAVHRPRPFQGHQRFGRPSGRRRTAVRGRRPYPRLPETARRRRAPRRRRVRRAAGRHRNTDKAYADRRAHHRRTADAVPARQQGDLHLGVDRHRAVGAALPPGRRTAARRRRGDVPRQGRRPPSRGAVRRTLRRDALSLLELEGDLRRAVSAQGVRAVLPADRRPRRRPRRRLRGAAALASSATRPAAAAAISCRRRRKRLRRADRLADLRAGVRQARAPDRRRGLHRHQCLRPAFPLGRSRPAPARSARPVRRADPAASASK